MTDNERIQELEQQVARLERENEALGRGRTGWPNVQAAEAEIARLREARAADTTMYLAQNGELIAEVARLRDVLRDLVTLVRIGFLVSVNDDRVTADNVNDPKMRELLFTILQAEDSETAARALLAEYGAAKNRVLMDANDEQAIRDAGAPVRCCENWPECSHVLDALAEDGAAGGIVGPHGFIPDLVDNPDLVDGGAA